MFPESRPECLAAVFAHWNGKPLNVAAIARRLGVSRPTARARLEKLEREGALRSIPFFKGGRKPLLYVRKSYPGCHVDAIMKEILSFSPESRFSWWKTGRVRQIDLIAEVGQKRFGFCFSDFGIAQTADWMPLRLGYRRGVIHHGFLLYGGSHAFIMRREINCLPLGAFLPDVEEWILRRCDPQEARAARERINDQELSPVSTRRPGGTRNPPRQQPHERTRATWAAFWSLHRCRKGRSLRVPQ